MPTQSVVGRRPLRKQLKHIFGYIYTCFFFLSLQKAIRYSSLRKQPTFSDATTDFILLQPIRSTTQIWVVTRHRYGISAHDSQERFRGETSGGVAKCRLFSQATLKRIEKKSGTVWTQPLRSGPSRSHTLNMVPERLTERFWFATFHSQSSPLNIHFRLSGLQSRSYSFTSAKIRITIQTVTKSDRNLSQPRSQGFYP